MAEEPEQVLPEKRRPPRMRLQAITYHQAGGNEETGPSSSIQNQEYASRKEHGEGQQSDAGSDDHAQVQIGMRINVMPLARRSSVWI